MLGYDFQDRQVVAEYADEACEKDAWDLFMEADSKASDGGKDEEKIRNPIHIILCTISSTIVDWHNS